MGFGDALGRIMGRTRRKFSFADSARIAGDTTAERTTRETAPSLHRRWPAFSYIYGKSASVSQVFRLGSFFSTSTIAELQRWIFFSAM